MADTRCVISVLLGLVLVSYVSAEEEEKAIQPDADSDGRVLVLKTPDNIYVVMSQIATAVNLVMMIFYFSFTLLGPLINRRRRSISSRSDETEYPMTNILRLALSSIDPIESTFAFMDVKEITCKKQRICELQKTASQTPFIGDLVRYVSPSIRGLDAYKDAMEVGDALQDCAHLFKCPSTQPQETRNI